MVSIKDIAARCGVSVATVSKALNGHTDVSASTRAAVRKAAADMGKVYMLVTLAILPVVIAYLLLSKFIVRGVALGGVKQ